MTRRNASGWPEIAGGSIPPPQRAVRENVWSDYNQSLRKFQKIVEQRMKKLRGRGLCRKLWNMLSKVVLAMEMHTWHDQ